jgi:ribosomal protein S6E (S10)
MHSGLVLEIQGGIDADGMPLVQNTNYKNKSQVWRI